MNLSPRDERTTHAKTPPKMSRLPHIAQRHPWHQAVYALAALTALKRQPAAPRKPEKQQPQMPRPDVAFWATFRMLFMLFLYLGFTPYFLRTFTFFVPFVLVGRWLLQIWPATESMVCGFAETLDTLAALINQEYARHVDELERVQDSPGDASHAASSSGASNEDEEENTVEEPAGQQQQPNSAVANAIQTQWQQLEKHLAGNSGRQHIQLPPELLNQHEPLFEANSERLRQHGYGCVEQHCYGRDCLVLLTSERATRQQQQKKPQSCNAQGCQCRDDESYCALF